MGENSTEGAPPPLPDPRTVARARQRKASLRAGIVLAVGLLIGSGFFHCVHGTQVNFFHLCPKDGWALSNTFVDLDDIVGRSRLELIDKMAVVRAMESCGMIDTKPRRDRDRDDD